MRIRGYFSKTKGVRKQSVWETLVYAVYSLLRISCSTHTMNNFVTCICFSKLFSLQNLASFYIVNVLLQKFWICL